MGKSVCSSGLDECRLLLLMNAFVKKCFLSTKSVVSKWSFLCSMICFFIMSLVPLLGLLSFLISI